MASVERIRQDMATLTQATQELAVELHQSYTDYLTALGQALRQQLVLSGYHVCTQGYPTQFLRLSLSQREALQRSLRALAAQAQASLIDLLSIPAAPSTVDPNDTDLDATDPMPAIALTVPPEMTQPLTPVALAGWQEQLETAIAREFRAVSFQSNRLLQQAGILPHKLPEFLKATSDMTLEPDETAAKVLDLLMNGQEQDSDEQDSAEATPMAMIVQLVAVHLQLTEVEFADGTTTILRNRLRSLAARLKTLKQSYLKKERELAIAQAQDAWRSSWSDD